MKGKIKPKPSPKRKPRAVPPTIPPVEQYPPLPPGTSPTKSSADNPFICAE